MPFIPSFEAVQIIGFNNQIVFTDTSTGSDVAITQRRIYLYTDTGATLVPVGTITNYVQWDILSISKTVDVLDKDYALLLSVQWLDVTDAVLYSYQLRRGFTQFNESFDYGLTQQMTGNPLLINDNNFYKNKSDFRTDIDSGNQALTEASDIFGAQQAYNRATKIRIASPYSFNANS